MLALLLLFAVRDTTGYWQQRVTYRIAATLDEPAGVLTGRARITYVNRSPDTLSDFFVHQHLNAFRPGSRWAAADSAEGRVRFQRLGDPDYAFERILTATVMGRAAAPDYPYAPDSTVAHWRLPRPLAPGDSLVAEIEWQARLSTVPRRQGRRGRQFDFAHWYPKVVVYDRSGWQDHPLYPAGEFYGEFATYDVTLDLPADQVIGATGVAVCGDPGWELARANPAQPVVYRRSSYPAAPTDCPAPRPGRRTVRFYAEDVHHFGFSVNPRYVYEEGRYGDVVVRALYLPEDRDRWGDGRALRSIETALAWLETLFGKFAWPQLTWLHRLDRGATEFPMLVMAARSDVGLALHEVGHNYAMGILANNEWREAWLDEGLTSFQTSWFWEARGGGTRYDYPVVEANVLGLDLDGWSEPVSTVSERFRDFDTYNDMAYDKGSLFFFQLRYVVGDSAMRAILREYYARWRLKHVDEDAFRQVAEEVSGQDLKWLFAQWLHGTPLIDYRLKRVERRELPDGRWRTAVTIERKGDGRMPVEIGNEQAVYARASGEPVEERVEFTTEHKPGRLMLDPRAVAHDWNMLNNRERRGVWGRGGWEVRIDDPTRETARRDRLVSAWIPVGWSNDFGGVTLGLRSRSNYFGRYERGLFLGTVSTREGASERAGFYLRWGNPVGSPLPRTETSVAAWRVEGRTGAALNVHHSLRRHLSFGADPHVGFAGIWMATSDLGYLDRRLWDDAGTIEAGPWVSTTVAPRAGETQLKVKLLARLGLTYRNPGVEEVRFFGRPTGEVSLRAPFLAGTLLGVRAFAGAFLGASPPPKQRRITVRGADPYETFANPFLRSRGALLVRPDFHYHAPGGANLRGFRSDLGGRWAAAVNAELTRSVYTRARGILRDVALEGFGDIGVVDSLAVASSPPGRAATTLYDAGVGLVARLAWGDLGWTMRFELPLVVNRPDRAADTGGGAGDSRVAFRWQVSFAPSF